MSLLLDNLASDTTQAAIVCAQINALLEKHGLEAPIIGVDTNLSGMQKVLAALQYLGDLVDRYAP